MLPKTLSTILLTLTLLGCSATREGEARAERPSTPFVVVLGTAQDGGLPQIGCQAELCVAARRHPEYRRLVASLLIVDPRSGKRWLIDATPDIREQVERADRWAPRASVPGRPPLFDGVFLTHAHFGHYTGLAYFGREVYGSKETAVWGTERMQDFLGRNGPWDLLVQAGHINLHSLEPGTAVSLGQDLTIEPILVPHRDEYTDTVGFIVRGPQRSLVYIPDIDKWSVFETKIEDLVGAHDLALLDGSFFDDGEIPGRAMSEIPHPFIMESIRRFTPLDETQRAKVFFTHLNHTNPASDPASAESGMIHALGMHVAQEGQVLEL